MEIPELVPVDKYDARQVSCFAVHMIEERLSFISKVLCKFLKNI